MLWCLWSVCEQPPCSLSLGSVDYMRCRNSQEHIITMLGEIHVRVNTQGINYRRRRQTGQPTVEHLRFDSNLQCALDCECRCHSSTVLRLIPNLLAPYVGQVHISKRLLSPPWSSWSRCNIQACRGDWFGESSIQWVLPSGFVPVNLQFSSPSLPFCFSIGTPRIIPYSAPIWGLLRQGDVEGVRELFARKQASVWDADENNETLLMVSVRLVGMFCYV